MAKELINRGKSGFSMKKYRVLITQYKLAKSRNIPLTDVDLVLLKDALEYSGVDTDILREIYKTMKPHRIVAQELCGLTCEAWTEITEAAGFFMRVDPLALFNYNYQAPKIEFETGFHSSIKVYIFPRLILESLISPIIRNTIIASETTDKKYSLTQFNSFFNQLVEYPTILDIDMYWKKVTSYIEKMPNSAKVANLGLYTYISQETNNNNVDEIVYEYDVMIAPSKASYLMLNVNVDNSYDFYKWGLSTLCKPLPKRLNDILCDEIIKIKNKTNKILDTTDTVIEKLLFPENKDNFYIDDFITTVKAKITNANKYESFLTNEEVNYLQNGGKFVEVNYLYTDKGQTRVHYPYRKDLNIIPEYYVNLLQSHFKSLNKVLISDRKAITKKEKLLNINAKLDSEIKEEIKIQNTTRSLNEKLEKHQKERLSLEKEKDKLTNETKYRSNLIKKV